jgi:hypothetical protein
MLIGGGIGGTQNCGRAGNTDSRADDLSCIGGNAIGYDFGGCDISVSNRKGVKQARKGLGEGDGEEGGNDGGDGDMSETR